MSKSRRRRPKAGSIKYPDPPLGPGQFCHACAYQFQRRVRYGTQPGRCPNCASKVWWVPAYLWRGNAKHKPNGGQTSRNPAHMRAERLVADARDQAQARAAKLFDVDVD